MVERDAGSARRGAVVPAPRPALLRATSERAIVHRGLSRARLVPVLGLALLVGAAVGARRRPAGRLTVAGGLAAGLSAPGSCSRSTPRPPCGCGSSPAGPSAGRFASLGMMFPLVTRALPLLLLFVTFLFINTEVWMVANSLDPGVLAMAVMFFAADGGGLPAGPAARGDGPGRRRHRPRPARRADPGHARRSTARPRCSTEIPEGELRGVLEVAGLQKWNLVLVLLVSQFVQVLLLSVAVLVFFLVFGSVVMQPDVVGSWLRQATTPTDVTRAAAEGVGVPGRLLRAVLHRLRRDRRDLPPAVLHSVTRELERAVAVRAVYRTLRR